MRYKGEYFNCRELLLGRVRSSVLNYGVRELDPLVIEVPINQERWAKLAEGGIIPPEAIDMADGKFLTIPLPWSASPPLIHYLLHAARVSRRGYYRLPKVFPGDFRVPYNPEAEDAEKALRWIWEGMNYYYLSDTWRRFSRNAPISHLGVLTGYAVRSWSFIWEIWDQAMRIGIGPLDGRGEIIVAQNRLGAVHPSAIFRWKERIIKGRALRLSSRNSVPVTIRLCDIALRCGVPVIKEG